MMQSQPPPYSAQPQPYAVPGPQGYYAQQPPPPVVAPSQPLVVLPYQQQQVVLVEQRKESWYWYLTCCFHRRLRIYLRHACILVGVLTVLHGILVITFGALTVSGKIQFGSDTDLYRAAYVSTVSLLTLVDYTGTGITAIFTLLFLPILTEVLGGGCLILGAIFLHDLLCLLSAAAHVLILLANVFGFVLLILAIGFAFILSSGKFASSIHSIAPFVVLIVHCIYVSFAIGASFALREQIKNGEYGGLWAPPQPSNAVQMYAPVMASEETNRDVAPTGGTGSPVEAITQEPRAAPNT